MSLENLLVLFFILSAFGAFMFTLAWASRPPRRPAPTTKGSLPAAVSTTRGIGAVRQA
jgi:hypothetical protein